MLRAFLLIPVAPESGQSVPGGQAPHDHRSADSVAAPTFTAPQPGGLNVVTRAPTIEKAVPKLEELQILSMKKALREGHPDAVERAARYLGTHGGLTETNLYKFILPSIAQRTDDQAPACLQKLLAVVKLNSQHVFHEAIIWRQLELAQDLLRLDPSAADVRHLGWSKQHCPELARAIADRRPDLVAELGSILSGATREVQNPA